MSSDEETIKKATKKKKKAFVLLIAATGHINPTICVCSELVKSGVDVIFYSVDKYKRLIERVGCRFVSYDHYPQELLKPQGLDNKNLILDYVNRLLTFTDQEMPRLIADMHREQPDMIICDQFSIHARYLNQILKQRYQKGMSSSRPPPKMVEICTSFIFRSGVSPTDEAKHREMIYTNNTDNWFYVLMLEVFVKQLWLNWKYGMSILDPIGYIFDYADPRLAIVSLCPDLQPKRDLFERLNYKFVGPCLDESVRGSLGLDARLKQVLDTFPPINPLSTIERGGRRRLVYVSLGTVVNDNEPIIKKIIAAIEAYQTRSDQFEITVLMSLGEGLFKRFQCIKLPDNFVIQSSVPQIEVLKRAALFVTHSGMNSSSETIHYAVPIISIPIVGDQMFNATRLTDELGFGRQFNCFKLDVDELSAAVEEILTNETYLEKIMLYSKISRRYQGSKLACNEILDYLNCK